ncbi:uncharacterized protein LOC130813838 [Amaranthus tricolor]|uniref:uncharacterized protein LOC130813838 n=1 Tax=Amaranthus tricolor TaxID=29722 RepID=UPI00258FAD0E|nr:uncharacterized protein LOC130813838 [Amaranthus tricolor]
MKLNLSASSSTCKYPLLNPPLFNNPSSISRHFTKGWRLSSCKKHKFASIKAVNTTSWDEKPFEILPDGKRVYLDEQDVITFLDPPKELYPLDPSSYNPASYLWKKISDIPEERRHRLLYLLSPGLISAAWEVAGGRYDDAKLAKMSSSTLLAGENDGLSLEYWNGRKSGGPLPLGLFSYFQKALFRQNEGIYGRIIGVSQLARMATSSSPLYFTVKEAHEVMPTEQPCDLAYEFGDGLLDLRDYPEGFPLSAKHPWPFNDELVIYVRHLGPGVMVGQVWQEGLTLEQIPKKLCSEILMVKNYCA